MRTEPSVWGRGVFTNRAFSLWCGSPRFWIGFFLRLPNIRVFPLFFAVLQSGMDHDAIRNPLGCGQRSIRTRSGCGQGYPPAGGLCANGQGAANTAEDLQPRTIRMTRNRSSFFRSPCFCRNGLASDFSLLCFGHYTTYSYLCQHVLIVVVHAPLQVLCRQGFKPLDGCLRFPRAAFAKRAKNAAVTPYAIRVWRFGFAGRDFRHLCAKRKGVFSHSARQTGKGPAGEASSRPAFSRACSAWADPSLTSVGPRAI